MRQTHFHGKHGQSNGAEAQMDDMKDKMKGHEEEPRWALLCVGYANPMPYQCLAAGRPPCGSASWVADPDSRRGIGWGIVDVPQHL